MNKYRIGTDVPLVIQISEGDVFSEWTGCTVLQVAMYSDDRGAFAGACTHAIDETDATKLNCTYPASVQMLTGALRLVVIFEDTEGITRTYDLADVFELVATSAEADSDGDTVTSANITVSGLPISVISEILNACIAATAAASGSVISEVSYTPSAADGGNNILHIEQADGTEYDFNVKNGSKGSQGEAGVGIASIVQTTTGDGDGGTNVVTVTKTDGTSSTFQVKNGSKGDRGYTGPQGAQGNSGYTGAAGELEVVNNLTDGGAAKALSAEMGVELDKRIRSVPVRMTFVGNGNTLVTSATSSARARVVEGHKYRVTPLSWDATAVTSNASYDKFGIVALDSSDAPIGTLAKAYIGGTIKDYYDVTIPTGGVTLAVTGRATSATENVITVEDITLIEESAANLLEEMSGVARKVVSDKVVENHYPYHSSTGTADGLVVGKAMSNTGAITSASSMAYTEDQIPVKPGDVITVKGYYTSDGVKVYGSAKNMRYVTAYADETIISSAGNSTGGIASFTVPIGINAVRITIAGATTGTYPSNTIFLTTPNGEETVYPARVIRQESMTWQGNLADGETVLLAQNDVEKNAVYAFSGKVSTMGTFRIGSLDASGSRLPCVEVTANNVTVYSNISGLSTTLAHGLTIANDLAVTIVLGNSLYLEHCFIQSGGQVFDAAAGRSLRWGNNHLRCPGIYSDGCTLTGCSFAFQPMDITRDTWVFGDSWTVLYEQRWTYWVVQWGFTKWLLSGIAGEDSAEALGALKNLLALATPKRIVWCLGGNDTDPDGSTVNASWKACVEELMQICTDRSIELILFLTPSMAHGSNEAKMAYVRESGYRYVNAADALGADAEGDWFPGYAEADGNHQTVEGAKALAARMIADVPELTIQ